MTELVNQPNRMPTRKQQWGSVVWFAMTGVAAAAEYFVPGLFPAYVWVAGAGATATVTGYQIRDRAIPS